jgi:predicted membrane channel-forming protein YqfA (hemolysin III family)
MGRSVHCLFLLAAANCFFTSAVYHCGSCCQDEARCAALFRADVTGIAVLIAASFLPGVYFGFACFPALQHAYLVMVIGLLIVGVGVSLFDCDKQCEREKGRKTSSQDAEAHPSISASSAATTRRTSPTAAAASGAAAATAAGVSSIAQRIRTAVFVCFVCLGLVVAVHWAILVAAPARSLLLPRIGGMLSLYGAGFWIYSAQQPERGAAAVREEERERESGIPKEFNAAGDSEAREEENGEEEAGGVAATWIMPPQGPGRYDVWGHSHQWWHLAVVAAVLVWHSACLEAHAMLRDEGCQAFSAAAATAALDDGPGGALRSSGLNFGAGLRGGVAQGA